MPIIPVKLETSKFFVRPAPFLGLADAPEHRVELRARKRLATDVLEHQHDRRGQLVLAPSIPASNQPVPTTVASIC
jgi:hypothetical protein